MIRVNPESGEDRAKILGYCEHLKLHVINARDVDGCVAIELTRDSIQGTALITGLKTNARAKFHELKESLLKELLALNERLLESAAHATIEQVKRLTPTQVLDKAEFLADGDDLTPLQKGTDLAIDEITTDDDGNPVIVLEAFWKQNRWIAHITFGPDFEVMRAYVEKDKTLFRR